MWPIFRYTKHSRVYLCIWTDSATHNLHHIFTIDQTNSIRWQSRSGDNRACKNKTNYFPCASSIPFFFCSSLMCWNLLINTQFCVKWKSALRLVLKSHTHTHSHLTPTITTKTKTCRHLGNTKKCPIPEIDKCTEKFPLIYRRMRSF